MKHKAAAIANKYKDHQAKCRCCLKSLEINEKSTKVTAKLQQQFKDLTQMQLKTSSNYSNVICVLCSQSLGQFSTFQKELIVIQTELYLLEDDAIDYNRELDPKLLKEAFVRLVRCSPDAGSVTTSIFEPVVIKCEPAGNVELKAEQMFDDGNQSCDNFSGFDDRGMENSDEEDCDINPKEDNLKATKISRIAREEAEPETLQCVKCDYTSTTKSLMTKHKRNVHGKKKKKAKKLKKIGPQDCDICHKTFASDYILRSHNLRVHLKKHKSECDLCGLKFFDRRALVRHLATHIAREFRPALYCDICGNEFLIKDSLRHHLKLYHTGRSALPCTVEGCKKSFPGKSHLASHIKYFHNKFRLWTHKCNFCGGFFKNLTIHQQSQHSEHFDLFLCDICSFSSKTANGLYKHKLRHGDKKFLCTYDGCKKGFLFAYSLNHHIEKNHEKKLNEVCVTCDKRFYCKKSLKIHEKNVHFSVKKSCPVPGCEKLFHRKDYCRQHIKSHFDITEEEKKQYWAEAGVMFPSVTLTS